MIKKVARFIMVVIMLLGISFSILNFISIKAETLGDDGHDVILPDGTVECYPPKTQCSVGTLPRI